MIGFNNSRVSVTIPWEFSVKSWNHFEVLRCSFKINMLPIFNFNESMLIFRWPIWVLFVVLFIRDLSPIPDSARYVLMQTQSDRDAEEKTTNLHLYDIPAGDFARNIIVGINHNHK